MSFETDLKSVADTEAFGARLARALPAVRLLYLRGPLGVGKTTLVRGLLRELGYADSVKSPTFTLVEPCTFQGWTLYHFDLYRLNDPGELEFIGIRDYVQSGVCVVEWPERGAPVLPLPDVDVMILPNNGERRVRLVAHTPQGEALLRGLK